MAAKSTQIPLKEKILQAYMDYILSNGTNPPSVYVFSKSISIKESEFYQEFSSFESLDGEIWNSEFEETLVSVKSQEVYDGYSAREKTLSLYFAFIAKLLQNRSFAVYSYRKSLNGLRTPAVFHKLKMKFDEFSDEVILEGLDTGEIIDRRFITDRYKDGLWVQFKFVVDFWVKDKSNGFEKTDEAIEKGVNLTFDLFARSPLDSLLDYGKFLSRNANFQFSSK